MEESKKNFWTFVPVILTLIIIILLILLFKPYQPSLSASTVGKKVVDFATSEGTETTLLNVNNKGGFYEVNLSISGQNYLVYATKDGKYLINNGGLIPLTPRDYSQINNPPAEIIKSDKPVAKAYVFSYCPYGLQFEKALYPVYQLLKNKTDIQIVFIGAMHGEYERIESLRQLCIQKNYGTDKLWKYLDTFNSDTNIGNCGGVDTCVNPLIEKIFKAQGIDKIKINKCMTDDAPTMYNAQESEASSLGIGGSPTFTVNGALANNVQRNPESIKQSICNSFNNPPSECETVLSTIETGAGFGIGTGSGSSSQC